MMGLPLGGLVEKSKERGGELERITGSHAASPATKEGCGCTRGG